MTHTYVFLCVTWHIWLCSCVWHASFIRRVLTSHNHMCPYVTQSDVFVCNTIRCVLTSHNQMCSYVAHSYVFLRHTIRCVPTWHIHMCGHEAFTCVTWLVLSKGHDSYWCVHTCDMAHIFVFLHVTCLIHMRSYLTHFVYVAWLNHMCHTTRFFHVAWLIFMCSYVWRGTSFCVSVCDMLHTYVFLCATFNMWLDTFTCATRLVFVECRVKWLIFALFLRSYVWHGTFLGVLVCDMPHTYVFSCVTWHIPLCDISDMTSRDVRYVTWLVHTCDMTHSCVWYDSLTRVTWPIHKCDMIQSCVWHDSFMRVTWLTHTCDMTHSYVWHDSFICVTWLIHMCDMPHSMCDMPHSCGWHDSLLRVTLATCCWRLHSKVVTYLHFFRWGRQLSS